MREISLHLLDLARNAAAAVEGMEHAQISIDLIWDERQNGGPQKAEWQLSERRKSEPQKSDRQNDTSQRRERQTTEQPESAPIPRLTLCVADNGRGMTAEQAGKAQSPFYTTRPKRGAGAERGEGFERSAGSERGAGVKRGANLERGAVPSIGLGIPLCKAAALRTGGTFSLESAPGCGTRVTAVFCPGHIDCAPLGDLPETLAVLVGGDPEIAFTVSAQVLVAEDDTPRAAKDAGKGMTADMAGSGAKRTVKSAQAAAESTASNAAKTPAKAAAKSAVQIPAFLAEPDTLRALTQGFPPGDARAIPRLKQYFTENLSLFLQKGEHGMKSLEELAAIRDKMKQTVETREAAHDATRVTVGMGTSGIAAGARGVLNAFAEEVTKSGLHGVLVTQSGSIGPAGYEPVVEVVCAGAEKVTYVKMTPEKAARVVAEHLAGAAPVDEYTIENA